MKSLTVPMALSGETFREAQRWLRTAGGDVDLALNRTARHWDSSSLFEVCFCPFALSVAA